MTVVCLLMCPLPWFFPSPFLFQCGGGLAGCVGVKREREREREKGGGVNDERRRALSGPHLCALSDTQKT